MLAKISDVRFRNPVYPGDETLIEVKKKEAMGGFTMMSGSVKKADGTRVLTVEFSVAWKTPEGQPLNPHRAACVKLVRADADFSAQTKLETISKAGAGVDHHAG